jgi:hypothetical protein
MLNQEYTEKVIVRSFMGYAYLYWYSISTLSDIRALDGMNYRYERIYVKNYRYERNYVRNFITNTLVHTRSVQNN